MDLRSDDFTRLARAPAKLNLFLEVLGRRSDGFHELETLMVPIQLFDQLAFTPSDAPSSSELGELLLDVRTCWRADAPVAATIPTGRENLVVKALELLRERSGCRFGAHVRLTKRIPPAAGLGGGSSDAACALRLANRAWKLNWDHERLTDLAAEIGSDVPFFLAEGSAICRGRGERVERLPARRPLHFVVVRPPTGLATCDVFRAYDEDLPKSDADRRRISEFESRFRSGSWTALPTAMFNRLQRAAGSISHWVAKMHSLFGRLDFVAHQLTGSGSAYFGVCRHAQHARRLASIVKTRQLGVVYATCSCQ
jgi:4-diphosphocytidyl-2-C-methyl-D-erythritol kinase